MRTLLLLRHAKSSWDDATLPDFERPLADRGRRDAPRMGKQLGKKGVKPELVISSPARRAMETAKAAVKAAGLESEILKFEHRIYAATSAELIGLVMGLPDSAKRVLMVGHNPGFEDLVHRLTGESNRMQTAALACIEFRVDAWADIEEGAGVLAWLLRPKELTA